MTRTQLKKFAAIRLAEILTIVLQDKTLLKRTGIQTRGKNEIECEVELDFLTSSQMKAIHKKFLGDPSTTDILSFPSYKLFRKSGYLGDLLICEPVLKLQAKKLKHTIQDEATVLLVHGVLHLLHFDHTKSAKEAKEMARLESRILTTLSELQPHKKSLKKTHSKNSPKSLIERSYL